MIDSVENKDSGSNANMYLSFFFFVFSVLLRSYDRNQLILASAVYY